MSRHRRELAPAVEAIWQDIFMSYVNVIEFSSADTQAREVHATPCVAPGRSAKHSALSITNEVPVRLNPQRNI
jgi:hypothetical protein